MHLTAWKGNSAKSGCRITHSPGPAVAGSPPATSWNMEWMSTSCGAGWICAFLDSWTETLEIHRTQELGCGALLTEGRVERFELVGA